MRKPWGWMAAPVLGMVAFPAVAGAQLEPEAGARAVMQWVGEGAEPGQPGPAVVFAYGEVAFEGKTIKGAPYSAEAVTEFVQVLADGNRIVRKSIASVYRDAKGRTRREYNAAGPEAATAEPRQRVLINDPVAGTNYVLDTNERTARKHPIRVVRSEIPPPPPGAPQRGERVKGSRNLFLGKVPPREASPFEMAVPPPPPLAPPPPLLEYAPEPVMLEDPTESSGLAADRSERLGKQVMEGLEVEGTRTTLTIPEGRIGNEQPLLIVTERWYSPELKCVVLSRRSDPRFGETTYRLTGIVRAEPPRALFEVPADFKVRDEPPSGDILIKKMEKRKPRE